MFKEIGPECKIQFLLGHFTELTLPKTDGILMANSLHYIKDQANFLNKLKNFLKPGGRLLIVEYETDHANPYVPYPTKFKNLENMALGAGFRQSKLLGSAPSRYHNHMYSALFIL